MFVSQKGVVGFGTSTPSSQAKLSVQGNILGSGNIVLYGTATSTINSGLTVGNNGALVVNQAASANSLYIATNGNVGIGTTAPGALLDIYKTTDDGATTTSQKWSLNSLYDLTLTQNRPAGDHIQYDFSQNINGVRYNVLTFKQGNVGIGTTAPLAPLSVSNSAATLFQLSSPGNNAVATITTNGSAKFQSGTYYPSNTFLPTAAMLGAGGFWLVNSNGNLVTLYSLDGSTTAMKVLAP